MKIAIYTTLGKSKYQKQKKIKMHRFLIIATSLALASGAPSSPVHVPTLDGRIVGGDPVSIEDYNYQASLLYFGSHLCGAVIISADVVLTAAHCTERLVNFCH